MDWTAVGTILATGAVSVAGVWLKGRYDAKAEKRRIDAERERVEAERQGAEAREKRAREHAEQDASRSAAAKALREFTALLDRVSNEGGWTDLGSAQMQWRHSCDASVRQCAETFVDSEIRRSVELIADAMQNLSSLASQNDLFTLKAEQPKRMARLLVRLAGCAARGEQLDDALRQDVSALRREFELAHVAIRRQHGQ